MKEFQNRIAQYLMNIKEAMRSRPKSVEVTAEKQDTQAVVDPVAPTRFDVRTVAGKYEITKKPDDFLE